MIQLVTEWRPMWPWVLLGLNEIVERTHPTWIPEDVYTELRAGTAMLATINDDAGFLILKRLADYDAPVLFVWALWARNAVEHRERADEITEALRDVARQAGCKRLQMRSPRKGWGRVGWRERETVYEREV